MSRHSMGIRREIMGMSNQLRRNADAVTTKYGGKRFTGTQSFIIGYIEDRMAVGIDVFQRDIERDFYISRSTASGILSLMEKNDLIRRVGVPQDARLKKLELTEKAVSISRAIQADLDRIDDRFETALTPEEQEQMRRYLNKLWKAIDEGCATVGLEPKKRSVYWDTLDSEQ